MSAAQAHLDEAKDEGKKQLSTISTQLSLGGQLALQMAKFGPILAFRINARTLMALPWGLVSAGAAGTATGVDGRDPTGVQLPCRVFQSWHCSFSSFSAEA